MKQKIISAGHICLDITPVFPETVRGQSMETLLQPGKLLHMDAADVHTGGSVANTGLALKLLGNEVELMGKIGEPFEVIVSECDETLPEDTPSLQAAELLSQRKAEAVAQEHPDAVVIGADTTVIHGETVLGKPKNREDCVRMLEALSGDTHRVRTGCTILCGERRVSFTEETLVTFYALSDAEIAAYADSGDTAAWAVDAAAFCLREDILLHPAGSLGPGETVSRAEVARLLHRMLTAAGLL